MTTLPVVRVEDREVGDELLRRLRSPRRVPGIRVLTSVVRDVQRGRKVTVGARAERARRGDARGLAAPARQRRAARGPAGAVRSSR